MRRSRRKAREAALQALYEVEVGGSEPEGALSRAVEEAELPIELAAYANRLVCGISQSRSELDARLSALIQDYDFGRLAVVDKNIMRIAAYELFHEPSIPPAVSLNEAIEIAKKYSTAESGRFVNGVLGRLLDASPKANWDPSTAPSEEEEAPAETPLAVEEHVLQADSDEAREVARVAGWRIRTDDP